MMDENMIKDNDPVHPEKLDLLEFARTRPAQDYIGEEMQP